MLDDTKQSKVIRITSKKEYEKLFTEIIEGIRDNTIKDFVIIAHQKLKNNDKAKYQVLKYWFGESGSCVLILGLLQYMISEVQNFIMED